METLSMGGCEDTPGKKKHSGPCRGFGTVCAPDRNPCSHMFGEVYACLCVCVCVCVCVTVLIRSSNIPGPYSRARIEQPKEDRQLGGHVAEIHGRVIKVHLV